MEESLMEALFPSQIFKLNPKERKYTFPVHFLANKDISFEVWDFTE